MTTETAPGPSWIGRGLILTLAVIVAVNIVILLRAPSHGAPAGGAAPSFSGRLVSGEKASLSDWRGKVVLLDFWATWCSPCLAEMPVLEQIHRRYSGQPFSVVGINAEGHDISASSIGAFARQRGVTYPMLVDDGTISRAYGVDMIPHLVLIDRDGRVRRTWDGGVGERELAAQIDPLLR